MFYLRYSLKLYLKNFENKFKKNIKTIKNEYKTLVYNHLL